MDISWVKKIRTKYERKNNNAEEQPSRQTQSGNIVQIRKKFYESYIDKNKSKSAQVDVHTADGPPRFRSFSDSGSLQLLEEVESTSSSQHTDEEDFQSNIEKSPSKVVNEDNVCIYVDSHQNSYFGSFRKRPRFQQGPAGGGGENDVMIRLKEVESEFQSIQRYESILRPPLLQQLIVSRHQAAADERERKPSLVASMVDAFNERAECKSSQEKLIDLEVIKCLRPPKHGDRSPAKGASQIFQQFGFNRSALWAEMKQVQAKNVLATMSEDKLRFMETQFELISSEASYNRSLAVLVDKFYNSPRLSLTTSADGASPVIRPIQKEHLFSNVLKIFAVSSKFLADMERRFCDDIFMLDICDTVSRYAETDFDVYVPYLQNQRFQTDAYNELKKNPTAAKVIKELESQPECCALTLDSFLLLPMQRLLRILLLLKNIKKCVWGNRKFVHDSVGKAIHHMEKVIKKCNDNKIHIDERQRMLEICSRLEFRNGQRKVNVSIGRLILEGEVKRGPKNSPRSILPDFLYFKDFWFILTSEYLLMTKTTKGKDVSYMVEDYYSLSRLSLRTSCHERDETLLEFKLYVKKSHKYDVFVVLTKSKEDWKLWRNSLRESLRHAQ